MLAWVALILACTAAFVWGDAEARGAIVALAVFAVIGIAANLTTRSKKDE